jgi:hypothetical protein
VFGHRHAFTESRPYNAGRVGILTGIVIGTIEQPE